MGVIREINVNSIVIRDRMRAFDERLVRTLADSMKEQGQLVPIMIRYSVGVEEGQPMLIAGLHRLKAAQKLKWSAIRSEVVTMDDLDAKLAEIDENLKRGELTPAEIAQHHHARKELYLERHPETGMGKAPGAGRGQGKRSLEGGQVGHLPKSYTSKAAEETGRAARTVRADVQRGSLGAEVLQTVKGTHLDKGAELDAMLKLTPEQRQRVLSDLKAGKKTKATTELKKGERAARAAQLSERRAEVEQTAAEPLYEIIVADPPWEFEVYSEEGKSRAAENHYPVEADDEILEQASERIRGSAYADSIFFLWVTAPKLAVALKLIERSGFTYRSHVVWRKDRIGTGYWARSMHEIALIATRGKPVAPAHGEQLDSVIDAKVGRHSQKPSFLMDWIDKTWPQASKIELFSRSKRPGWTVWGLEAPTQLDDILDEVAGLEDDLRTEIMERAEEHDFSTREQMVAFVSNEIAALDDGDPG